MSDGSTARKLFQAVDTWINLYESCAEYHQHCDEYKAMVAVIHEAEEANRAEIRKYNALLKRLKPKTRVQVGNSNFVRVMPKKGVSLPLGYVYPPERFTRYIGPLEEAPKGNGNSLENLLQ